MGGRQLRYFISAYPLPHTLNHVVGVFSAAHAPAADQPPKGSSTALFPISPGVNAQVRAQSIFARRASSWAKHRPAGARVHNDAHRAIYSRLYIKFVKLKSWCSMPLPRTLHHCGRGDLLQVVMEMGVSHYRGYYRQPLHEQTGRAGCCSTPSLRYRAGVVL